MAVPNTNTFNLQNVVDEVNPTTDDLQDCFNDSVDSLFDPLYEGNKDSLYNFRNYGGNGNRCRCIYFPDTVVYNPNTDYLYYTQSGEILTILMNQLLSTQETNGVSYLICSSTVPEIKYNNGAPQDLPSDVVVSTGGSCTSSGSCSPCSGSGNPPDDDGNPPEDGGNGDTDNTYGDDADPNEPGYVASDEILLTRGRPTASEACGLDYFLTTVYKRSDEGLAINTQLYSGPRRTIIATIADENPPAGDPSVYFRVKDASAVIKVNDSGIITENLTLCSALPPPPADPNPTTISVVATSASNACSASNSLTSAYASNNDYIVGKTVYQDVNLTVIYTTTAGYYRIPGDIVIQLDNVSKIISVDTSTCGLQPLYTAFTMTTQKYFQTSNINCSDTTYTTYYHDGTSSEPKLGDTIYEDSLGETPHNGLFFGSNAWRVLSSSRISVAVSSNGVVTGTDAGCAF